MKGIIISIVISAVVIVGVIVLVNNGNGGNIKEGENVSMVDGKQIIEIDAKGGYFPRKTIATAEAPTVIRMNTKGTFDCSSALVIPKIGYRSYLPSQGQTDIELGPQKSGTKIQGLCSMGMYNFEIEFQ
ncbi:hypothetical protein HYT00_01320 [Candidatus Giovannonibacteria bacterium]|nr:hypothetical protein [Candidatus Giovannonibacteria bacterium]